MKLRKILGSALIFTSLLSINAFAASANHGSVVNRNGLWADGYAYTSWDRAHITKMRIGSKSTTAPGTTYSQTGTITGMGAATSGYWET